MGLVTDKLMDEINKQASNPDQKKRILDFLAEAQRTMPLPTEGVKIDYFNLTVALCAAAFCVGKYPSSMNMADVRSTAVGIAKKLFDEEGNLLEFGK